MRKHIHPARRAFTLLELLVVIAIIAIVATMLFAALGGVRQKADAATSLNNLKQWATALNTCAGENNGRFPSDGSTGSGASGSANLADTTAWFNMLPPYMKEKSLSDDEYKQKAPQPPDRSVWINPAVPKVEALKYISPPEKYLFCYGMNSYLSSVAEPMQPANRIQTLSATVFLSEKCDDKPDLTIDTVKAFFGPGKEVTEKDNAAHFLFCDGHVELIKRSAFDPSIRNFNAEDPGPEDTKNINKHFTLIPYPEAEK